ncbi:MAG: hypothetical protein KKB51_20335 [Candidatus Riflebacteria bacterium]|nr:hypothetical protein [Candidatus Riflebacteria bacterium]
MKARVLIGLLFVLLSAITFADSPVEKYNFTLKDIIPSVMRDTIGVITINANFGWEPDYHVDDVEIPLCENASGSFTDAGNISLQKDTRALTSYGYGGTGSFRYPVTECTGDYCRIIIDPQTDKRVWIDKKKLAKNIENGFELTLFDSMENVGVDLFFFTNSKKKKIYSEPAKNSSFVVIAESTYPALEAAETKNGFVRLVISDSNSESNSLKKTIGWARIRDNEGLISIWITDLDEC